MSIGRYLQVICIWVQTIFYSLGGYFCIKGGGVMSIIGTFFILVGITHIVKLFDGSILKFQSH